jgi:pilus assembly protein Flp/PilA
MQSTLMFRAGRTAALNRFLRDERGATAIEYALIAAGIGTAVASTVWTLGAEVRANLYDKVAAIF